MGGMNNQIGSISQEMEINNQQITVRILTAILPENLLQQNLKFEKSYRKYFLRSKNKGIQKEAIYLTENVCENLK